MRIGNYIVVNVRVRPDIWPRVKALCKQEDISVREFVERALEQALAARQSSQTNQR